MALTVADPASGARILWFRKHQVGPELKFEVVEARTRGSVKIGDSVRPRYAFREACAAVLDLAVEFSRQCKFEWCL